MLEKDIRVRRAFAVTSGGDMGEVGQECRRAIDLVEDRVGERGHAGNVGRVAVGLEVAIGGIDICVGIDGTNRAVEGPLDEASSDPIVGVALP
jgi:hypothetical protein